ncbi:hypothetical protein [Photobacterium kishitanii]|uniref:hypothetical protein n=1 Tax=Photobacterium kishitanii TaxID=318456 RepID=UPI000D16B497|nr:hypothetical protein [Photobacterium kishitanii]PSV25495.1 hypothetical protein C0W28_00815 [Photobacterium kishitanii]
MKKIIISCALLCCSSAAFAGSWAVGLGGQIIATVSNVNNSGAVGVGIVKAENNLKVIITRRYFDDSDCQDGSKDTSTFLIDNQMVNVTNGTQCFYNQGIYDSVYYVESEKGINYIINQFKNKNSVRVNGYRVNAKGFTATLKKLTGLKKAI